MADNILVDEGAGKSVATDDVSSVHFQKVKLDFGGDGVSVPAVGSAARGLEVDPRLKVVRLAVTPTISTGIYAAKDAVGGLMTFSAAARASGGSGTIRRLVVIDKDQERANLDLVLFRASIGAPTDNAVFDPTDTELADSEGVVPVGAGDYADFNDNAVASIPVDHAFSCSGSDLFGVLVSRGTPTFTGTSDLVVILHVVQD